MSTPNPPPLVTDKPGPKDATGWTSTAFRHDFAKFFYTLVIGTAGGAIFTFLSLPLAWMLGAMVAASLAAILNIPVKIDMRLRNLMLIVLGTMLGSSFSPEILDRAADWPLSLSALALYALIAGGIGFTVYRRVFGYSTPTAYFSGAPGGFNEMVMIGTAMGGDERTISLSHATRVFIVVMVIPFWFRFTGDYQPAPAIAAGATGPQFLDLALLAAGALVGLLAARLMRIPAPHLTGPMLVSAAIHLLGWTAAAPPQFLIAFSQVIVGAAIGARFSGIKLPTLTRAIRTSTLVSTVMMLLSAGFATVLTSVTSFAFAPLLLAFIPGGLAEMSLVALALNVDAAFVATHHIARITIIIILAPLVFRVFPHRRPPPKD